MYQVLRPSRSEFTPIRGQRYHLRHWSDATGAEPPLLLVHGWMDVAASWQFMVDALPEALVHKRSIVAPDLRGFGLTRELGFEDYPQPTRYGHADHYMFADYLADLDALLDHLNTSLGRPDDAPFDLVGHSMGGNVVMMYAGLRPQRIRRLVNLEGFGMPASRSAQAPGRYVRWLDEIKALRQGRLALKAYDHLDGVAQRLMKTNARLAPERARWLAQHWAAPNPNGGWEVLGDAAHKIVNAQLYRIEEVLEVHRRITAPLLAVEAADDSLALWFKQGEHTRAQHHERLKVVPDCRIEELQDAGHMLHHDQPEALAALLDAFLASTAATPAPTE
jgi:pimeloyl-ACP methyl ester carboxylesterase